MWLYILNRLEWFIVAVFLEDIRAGCKPDVVFRKIVLLGISSPSTFDDICLNMLVFNPGNKTGNIKINYYITISAMMFSLIEYDDVFID